MDLRVTNTGLVSADSAATDPGPTGNSEKGQSIVEFALVVSFVMVGMLAVFEFTNLPGTFYAGLRSMYLDLSSLLALPFP